MKNSHPLNLFLATLLFMTVLTADLPFVGAIEWSSETQLTTDPHQDRSPSIMQAGDGTIWVVWASDRMGLWNEELFYTTSSDYGSNWSSDTRLTTASGHDSGPSIMQASNGSIWVVWSSNREGNYEIYYKTYNGSGWSNETRLTDDSSDDNYPSIVQLSNGSIWVVWSSYRTGDFKLFHKAFNGTGWSSENQLTYDSDSDEVPSIAQARDGTIWVVWQSGDLPNLYYKVYDGSDWSSDNQLTSDPANDIAASIAQIYDRKIWVVWTADRDEDFDIYYKTTVPIPGDVNGDGTVDVTDLALIGEAYGTVEGDPDYNPYADLNCDDMISIYDLAECSKNCG